MGKKSICSDDNPVKKERKTMKKKIITAFIAAVMTVSMMASCTNDGGNGGTTSTAKPSETTAQQTTTEAPETTTAASEETDKPSTSDGASVNDVLDAVKEAYGEGYYPNMPVEDDAFFDKFGVSKDDVDEYVAEVPMISTNVDTFVAVKAKDGKGESVEASLNLYRDALVSDTMQYPMNLPKIQASEVYRVDDYVFFVMLGEIPTEKLDESDEAALEAAKENNAIAIKAIDSILK